MGVWWPGLVMAGPMLWGLCPLVSTGPVTPRAPCWPLHTLRAAVPTLSHPSLSRWGSSVATQWTLDHSPQPSLSSRQSVSPSAPPVTSQHSAQWHSEHPEILSHRASSTIITTSKDTLETSLHHGSQRAEWSFYYELVLIIVAPSRQQQPDPDSLIVSFIQHHYPTTISQPIKLYIVSPAKLPCCRLCWQPLQIFRWASVKIIWSGNGQNKTLQGPVINWIISIHQFWNNILSLDRGIEFMEI